MVLYRTSCILLEIFTLKYLIFRQNYSLFQILEIQNFKLFNKLLFDFQYNYNHHIIKLDNIYVLKILTFDCYYNII